MRRIHSFTAILLLLALVPLGCSEKNVLVEPPPPEVQVAYPLAQKIRRSLEFTGTVDALETVDVRPRVKGFLEEIRFEEGSPNIKKGDVLFIIDQEPFEVKVQGAEAAVEVAKAMQSRADAQMDSAMAEQKNAQVQLARSRAAGGAVTQSEIDELVADLGVADASISGAKAARKSADSQLASAEASLREAKLDLSYTEVISRVDGTITESLVDEGNLVDEATHLATIVKSDKVYADFFVSETDHLRWLAWQRQGLVQGDASDMEKEQKEIYLGLATDKDYPHKGYVDYADPALDASSGTLRVRGIFENPDGVIPINAFVRVKVPLFPQDAILVDEVALGRDDVGPYVLVVNEDNMVERRSVELAEQYQGMRIVLSGLTPQDRLVINGLQRARPGAKVAPVPAEMKKPEDAPAMQPPAAESPTIEIAEPEVPATE